MKKIEQEVRISIGQRRILSAFFESPDLHAWWRAARCACEAREKGLYLVEWDPGPQQGGSPAAGILAGVVSQFHTNDGFTVDSCYWIPRGGEPIGPVLWSVGLVGKINQTVLRVEQSGTRAGKDWKRFVIEFSAGWPIWLESLQRHLQG